MTYQFYYRAPISRPTRLKKWTIGRVTAGSQPVQRARREGVGVNKHGLHRQAAMQALHITTLEARLTS
jgi:hypothetical protein